MNSSRNDHCIHAGPMKLCRGTISRLPAAVALLLAFSLVLMGNAGLAQAAKGTTKPYFGALKADEVHVRKGPGRDYDILWTYRSLGLPVEVTAQHEHWRRIRDSGGSEGWVYFRLITALRMALIAPWQKKKGTISLQKSASGGSAVVARLEPGVQVLVKTCTGASCLVTVGGFKGWIAQKKLWGVYPGEIIN